MREDVRDDPNEAGTAHDRRVQPHPVDRPGRDHERMRERATGRRGDRGIDGLVVLREPRALLEVHELLELQGLDRGCLVRDGLCADLLVPPYLLFELGLGTREAREVVVAVPERLRDAGRGDLERAQRGRAGALDAVQRSGSGRAERDRDQRQRHEDEHDHDCPTDERAASLRGVRRRLGALNRRSEHRRARTATTGCHRNRLPRLSADRVGRLGPSSAGRCASGLCCCGGWPRTPRGCVPSPPRRT